MITPFLERFIWAKISIFRLWLQWLGYRCTILRDNLSNRPVQLRINTSRKSGLNEPKTCWFRRICRYRKSPVQLAFLTKAIWRAIFGTWSVPRLDSFGGRNARLLASASVRI